MPILDGQIYYTFVNPKRPDSYKGKEFWKVTLVPSKDSLKKAKELGLKLKDPSDRIPGVNMTFRRNVLTRSGARAEPVEILDAKKNPWPSNTVLGNGTEAKIKFSLIDLADGPIVYLEKIQVINLVEFATDEDFIEEDGVDMSKYSSEKDKEDFEDAVEKGPREEDPDPDFD